MKNPGRMENVTRRLVATLLSLSMVILFASASQAAINCTQCHGNGSTSSLPKDTHAASASYRNISTGAVMGNHSTHSGLVTTGGPCARCHGAAAASYTSNHAILKNYSIRMSASMNYNKGAGVVTAFKQTATPTLGTCSTVNCHFESEYSSNLTPTWGQVIPWAAGKLANDNNANCTNTCHGTTGLTSGAHAKHITAGGGTQASCAQCHPDINAAVGTAAFKHATSNTGKIKMSFAGSPNGTGSVNAGLRTGSAFLPSASANSLATCINTYCHGAPATPQWFGGATNCASCHDASNNSGLSTRHNQHYNLVTPPTVLAGGTNNHQAGAYVYACLNCHPTGTHATGPADATGPVFQDAQVVGGTKITTHTPGTVTSSQDGKFYNFTNNATCTSVCHTRTGLIGAAPVVAADWSGAATGGCAVCHRAAGDNYTVMTTDGNRLTDKHALHMATDRYGANTNFTCEACHTGTAVSNAALQATPAARNQHPDTNKNVAFGTFAGGAWSGTQCTNTYCHSTGQSTTGSHGVLSWSGVMLGDCSSCHGGNSTAGATTRIRTFAHAQHLYSTARLGKTIGCADCHIATVSSDSTIVGYTRHVNKLVNVKFDNVINKDTDAPTYNISTIVADGATKTPSSTTYSCANVYCHSYGNVNSAGTPAPPTTFVSVAWNAAPLGCDGCHGGGGKSDPIYGNGGAATQTANSHDKHVNNNAFGCDYCHYNTVTQNTTTPNQVRMNNYSGHLNRDVNIRLKLNGGKTGVYAKAAKNCTNTYCHGTGSSPSWGNNGVTNCITCHSANSGLPGAHLIHVQTASLATSYKNMSGNVSSATQYRFSCAACHSYDAGAPGARHVNGNQPGGVYGPAEVLFGFSSATMRGTYVYDTGQAGIDPINGVSYTAGVSGTCSTTYCHSDGNGGRADKTAFTWASPTNTLRCNGCHGVQDWKLASAQPAYSSIRTNAHARHIRGDINTELNVGNGLTCNRCHGATVSATMNSYTTVGAGVLNKKRHVNKMRDYSGVTPNPNGGPTVSSGQFNPTAHTCSNVYCHSNSKIGTTSVKYASPPDAWNSGATLRKCNYCHGRQNHAPTVNPDIIGNFSRYSSTGVPNYASGIGGAMDANSHRQHIAVMGTTDYSNTNVCYSCHAQTLDSTTGKSASAAKFRAYSSRHTSGVYNVKMKAAYGGSTVYNGTVGTKTCSATLCHGTGSPKWGANNDTNSSCTKCHGMPTALTNYSSTTNAQSAPGYGQAGIDVTGATSGTPFTNGVSADTQVGAHDAHMRAVNKYTTRKVLCTDCHTVPAAPIAVNHLDGLTATQMTFSDKAKNTPLTNTGRPGEAGALTSQYLAGTCSAIYCHGGSMAGGSDTTPNWNQTDYTAQYNIVADKTVANCGKCHGAPPTALPSNSLHGGYTIADPCIGCHNHEGNGPQHIDGVLQAAGGCNGCHDYDTGGTLTNGVWSGGGWGKNAKDDGVGQGYGAHIKHINIIKTRLGIFTALSTASLFGQSHAKAVCGTCHTNTLAKHNTGGGIGDVRTINFGDGSNKVGVTGTTLNFGAVAPFFNGSSNSSSAVKPKSCSNISCHYFTSPNWSNYP